MKSNTPLFYFQSPQALLLNASAFEQIQSLIPYAVIISVQDVYKLEFSCHENTDQEPLILYQQQVTSKKDLCRLCMHRLKPLVGNTCPMFQPINAKMPCDFHYLRAHLQKIKAREEGELATYFDMHASYKNSENDMKEMSYQEYTFLLSFFAKLNQGIDTLHRWRTFFLQRLC